MNVRYLVHNTSSAKVINLYIYIYVKRLVHQTVLIEIKICTLHEYEFVKCLIHRTIFIPPRN